jgi:hypothetical protein
MDLKSVLIFFVLAYCNCLFAQTDSSNVDSLLCKKWILQYYEEDGEKYPPSQEHKNDLMVFSTDKTVKSIENEKIQNGTWAYDKAKKTLTIVDIDTKEKMVIRVIKLTVSEFIIEFKDAEGIPLRICMKPKPKE